MARTVPSSIRTIGKLLLDFALPPRCAGCSDIIEEAGSFCPSCWTQMEWLGNAGCQRCGLPLEGTELDTCGRCLADPPRLDRMRAAVTYGEMSRSIALRLKYGRKVGLARTMAHYMASLKGDWPNDSIIMPVPLHRWRLWGRGFNQSSLIAREVGKAWGVQVEQHMLRRVKRTAFLKGLNHSQRRRAVAGAFAVSNGAPLGGRTVILIDDVLTSGSTAEACARAAAGWSGAY